MKTIIHWTQADIDLMLKMKSESISNDLIAEKLNRTVKAVRTKLTKLYSENPELKKEVSEGKK